VWTADRFGYDVVRDVWICPADKLLARQTPPHGARGPARASTGTWQIQQIAQSARSVPNA
jgi:hypothetical protein